MQSRRPGGLVLGGALLGALCGLVILALAGRTASRPRPASALPALLSDAEGALAEVVMHYVPRLDSVLAEPYTDFLRAIDRDVRVIFVVPEDFDEQSQRTLDQRIAAIDPSGALAERLELVPSPGPITPWSKDRALVTAPAGPRPVQLLAPSIRTTAPSAVW